METKTVLLPCSCLMSDSYLVFLRDRPASKYYHRGGYFTKDMYLTLVCSIKSQIVVGVLEILSSIRGSSMFSMLSQGSELSPLTVSRNGRSHACITPR
jgi:hypothetical protein